MDELSKVVKRALGYPYAVPSASFALLGGRTLHLDAVEVDLSARIPLLAYASNAAPEVLARKLAAAADPVPMVRAVLSDFDVVYSAHVSAYGSVPATLQRSPGTEALAFVAFLTRAQLDLIAATEPNYELSALGDSDCHCEEAELPAEIAAYRSRHGALLDAADSEIALAAVEARGRRFPAMSQREVLEFVRDRVCPGRSLSELISLSSSGSWHLATAGLRSSSSTRARNSSR